MKKYRRNKKNTTRSAVEKDISRLLSQEDFLEIQRIFKK